VLGLTAIWDGRLVRVSSDRSEDDLLSTLSEPLQQIAKERMNAANAAYRQRLLLDFVRRQEDSTYHGNDKILCMPQQ
jgi:hypothetical protein